MHGEVHGVDGSREAAKQQAVPRMHEARMHGMHIPLAGEKPIPGTFLCWGGAVNPGPQDISMYK